MSGPPHGGRLNGPLNGALLGPLEQEPSVALKVPLTSTGLPTYRCTIRFTYQWASLNSEEQPGLDDCSERDGKAVSGLGTLPFDFNIAQAWFTGR